MIMIISTVLIVTIMMMIMIVIYLALDKLIGAADVEFICTVHIVGT